jgi:uncharacterized protein DUF2637
VAADRESGRVLRLLGLIAVALGLAALTAAACTLSYTSIHHLAIDAGVSRRLAATYPFLFDALLVIAGCAVLALRGAGLPSKIYAWFCLLVLLAALAAGGAARAAAVHIPHRLAGIVAAVVPWALVMIGFGLLLALLRYARIRRQGRRMRVTRRQTASANGDSGAAAPPEVVVIANVAEPPSDQPQLAAGAQPVEEPINPRPAADIATTAPAEAEPARPAPDQESAPDNESTLNPAPVDDEPTDPPALQRPRSSPTPPGD